jgi:hypothetical protein
MKIKISSLLLSLLLIASCSKKIAKKESVAFNKQIDIYISTLIKADEILGLAIAVIKNEAVIHKKKLWPCKSSS